MNKGHEAEALVRLGLDSPLATHRKRVARALVDHLRPEDVEGATRAFEAESSPEVYKWLGMALARTRNPRIVGVLEQKRQVCTDPNATDWLIAAQGAAQPMLVSSEAGRLVMSRDLGDRTTGAIRLWGARTLSDSSVVALQTAAAESDDPHLRRWALLTLDAHHIAVPSAVLVDNLDTSDYLLQEWSLHVLGHFRPPTVRSRVMAIVDDPSIQHPRVLEWASHAASSYDLADPDIDELLLDLHKWSPDADVREACLGELGRRLNGPAAEYLEQLCSATDDGYLLANVVALRDARSPALPRRVAAAIEAACGRIDPTDAGLRYFLANFRVSLETRMAVDRVLGDPLARIAARARLSEPHQERQAMQGPALRVGVVIALLEEYRYLAEVVALEYLEHPTSRRDYFRSKITAANGTPIELIATVVGRTGASFAVASAQQLMADYDPHVLVSLGISGQVHPKDGELGDVVIAESTTAYLDNFKAVDDGKDRYRFAAGTESFRSDADLVRGAALLEIEDAQTFNTWQRDEREFRTPFDLGTPQVWRGPIAAGPGVAASQVFKDWVRSLNRGFLAIDMESAGVAQTSWLSLERSRLLMIRGLSDGANAQKDDLDTTSEVPYRRLAMRAAASYLVACLDSFVTRGKLP